MKAARALENGRSSVMINADIPRPKLGAGQLLVRVKAAGVGKGDALVREGKLTQRTLASYSWLRASRHRRSDWDLRFRVSRLGDEVYGATNEQLTGAYAEYALPSARMMAQKPKTLNFIEAASAPIVTVTAWQMLFDYAHAAAGQTVLIHGAAGNVGTSPYNWPGSLALCASDRSLGRPGLCQRSECGKRSGL